MRPRASFCHRCGRPLPDEAAVIYSPKTELTEFQSSATEELKVETEISANHREETLPPEIGEQTFVIEREKEPVVFPIETADSNQIAVEESALPAESNPETAIKKPLAKKTRRVVKTTEYVWEEPTSDPTWRFLLFTVLAVVFVALVFWLARFITL
jgi:cobalamin biosynthesis Mg chelatase CobN